VPIQAVIFDLDGTLLDTLEDIADSTNSILAKRNFPLHDLAAYRRYVGDGLGMLIERVLPEGKRTTTTIHECVKAFRDEYAVNWNNKTKPYSGVLEMLDKLTARKLKLAVLSNKPDDFTKRCVSEYLSQWPFDIVKGLNSSTPPKPDPTGAQQIADYLDIRPPNILYLGDSGVDMKTAISAEMFPIGALWGFKPQEELEHNGAQVLIKHPQELLTLLT
jgi:phosphoglycolate phosphatase